MAKRVQKPKISEEEIAAKVAELKSGNSTSVQRMGRPSLVDALKTIDKSVQNEITPATAASAYRIHRLFTGIVDFDLFCGLVFGKRVQIEGEPNYGKSLLTYIFGGAAHKTCRHCYTPIIQWHNDWDVLQTGAKPESTTTCRCGANDKMATVYIDAEDCYDPYWSAVWGLDESQEMWDGYENIDVENNEDGNWQGIKMSPDQKNIVIRPTSSASVEATLIPLIKSGAVDIVFLDSLAAFAIEEDLEGHQRLGSRARFMSRLLPLVLSAQLSANKEFGAKVSLVATNQYRQGPVANPRANPNRAAGGRAIEYTMDQIVALKASKVNQALTDGYKERAVMRDISFAVSKAKTAGSGGGQGDFRVFLDDYQKSERIFYKAGQTNEPEKLYDYVQQVGTLLKNENIFSVIKNPKGAKTGYKVLGREFTKVKDIVSFFQRRDIQYQLRFILYAAFLPVSGRMHLRPDSYNYNPYKSDPILEIIESLSSVSGDALRRNRNTPLDEFSLDD
jgi:RecA/RadA recombinase